MQRFNVSHVTKVGTQIFVRDCKRNTQMGKISYRFLDFINRK